MIVPNPLEILGCLTGLAGVAVIILNKPPPNLMAVAEEKPEMDLKET